MNAVVTERPPEAETCEWCAGAGYITETVQCGGIEVDADDQPCPDCTGRGWMVYPAFLREQAE